MRRTPNGLTAEDRFWKLVLVVENCWEWIGHRASNGYGIMAMSRTKKRLAHRWAFEHFRGPIPAGLTLDHLCKNPGCVNPDHLDPVTLHENLLRGDGWSGKNGRKTHCKRGHPFDEANTYRWSQGRACKECRRIRDREKYAREAKGGREAAN